MIVRSLLSVVHIQVLVGTQCNTEPTGLIMASATWAMLMWMLDNPILSMSIGAIVTGTVLSVLPAPRTSKELLSAVKSDGSTARPPSVIFLL